METVNLGIDPTKLDPKTAITMAEARALIRGRRGHIALEVLRRWSNPNRGCRIHGVQLVLPSLKVAGVLLTMREWVEQFERTRIRLSVRQVDRKFVEGLRSPRQKKRDQDEADAGLRAAGMGK